MKTFNSFSELPGAEILATAATVNGDVKSDAIVRTPEWEAKYEYVIDPNDPWEDLYEDFAGEVFDDDDDDDDENKD